jgi:hypothetical protein
VAAQEHTSCESSSRCTGEAGEAARSQSRTNSECGAEINTAARAGAAGHAIVRSTRTRKATWAAIQVAGEFSQGTATVIVHVVLFRPRADLSLDARRALIDAWAAALRDIPSIHRAQVGPRIRVGRSYEELNPTDLPYAALLEFDHMDALRAYLDHPAHEAMSTRFFGAIADALIYDFDVEGNADGLRGML